MLLLLQLIADYEVEVVATDIMAALDFVKHEKVVKK
jgi:hypothetical protein